jgi:hypothetical protein
LPCPFFSWTLERFQPITTAATCTVSINVLEPGAFNAESQYFIPLFNKISRLCAQQQRGDEASNGGGCNSGPIGYDFNIYRITLIFTFTFLPWELGSSQNVRTDPVLILDPRWEFGRFSPLVRIFNLILMTVLIVDSHREPNWKPAPVMNRRVRTTQSWSRPMFFKIKN